MIFLKMIGQAILNALALIIAIVLMVLVVYFIWKNKNKDDQKKSKAKRLVIKMDKVPEDKPLSPLSSRESTIYYDDFRQAITHLQNDPEIEEVILMVDDINLTPAQIEEVRPLFKKLRKNKNVIALATTLERTSYQTSLLADKIYLLDTNNSSISLRAHIFSDIYYKTLLDKIGLKLNPIHIGDYKVAGENYARESMSENRRQSLLKTGHSLLDYLVTLVKKERNIDIENPILQGDYLLLTRQEACEIGLIDADKSEQDLKLNKSEENISLEKYLKKIKQDTNDPNIALVYLEGNITSKSTSSTYISYDNVEDKLKQIKKDDSIKGLVLRINSPGGSALESERIYRLIKDLDIPVYASMGDYAASGGYYIASACHKIYANQNTITGSIGVVALLPELEDLASKAGVKVETVSLGQGTNFMNLFQKQDEKSLQLLNSSLEATYREFKDRVLNSRNMSEEELEKIAGGRTWLGQEAVENGLVDGIKTIDQVIDQMKEDLDLTEAKVKVYREKKSLKDLTLNLELTQLEELTRANSGIMYLETIEIK